MQYACISTRTYVYAYYALYINSNLDIQNAAFVCQLMVSFQAEQICGFLAQAYSARCGHRFFPGEYSGSATTSFWLVEDHKTNTRGRHLLVG